MLEKLEKIFQDLIEDKNIEISYIDFESEGGHDYLRVYLEKKDGDRVSIDDCEKVSHSISDVADEEIKGPFMLEVSSPGIERKLCRKNHFLKFIGDKINVRTKNNVHNSKKFEGKLIDFVDDNIILDDEKLGIVEIPLEKVKVAKNIFDFSSLLGKKGGK